MTLANGWLYACLVCGMLLLPSGPAMAENEDEYLEQLSAEISKPEYLDLIEAEILTSEKTEKEQSGNGSENYGNIAKFEGVLQKNFSASYTIYKTLSIEDRLEIFEEYKTTRKMSAAKRKIVDLYLGM